ncbi:hypothetical protein HYY72_04025 [Candidatus Woesearchaeota archaeon]|nr:hypothetical protein [Candidatus Woesearchaeota archaeon]
MKISRDTPLAEITLRKYERPSNIRERELVKKLCLTLGLLQPGDSRDVVVDVLHVLLKQRRAKRLVSCSEIERKVVLNRKMHRLPMLGIASSNIRRQLKRLKELFIVEKVKGLYRITEFMPLGEIYDAKLEKFLLQSIVQRAREYFSRIDEAF